MRSGEDAAPVHAGRVFNELGKAHIPDRIPNYLSKDAWARNHRYRIRGALGSAARAYSLRASTYRPIAGGERTLTV
jgi:hypothetical protein